MKLKVPEAPPRPQDVKDAVSSSYWKYAKERLKTRKHKEALAVFALATKRPLIKDSQYEKVIGQMEPKDWHVVSGPRKKLGGESIRKAKGVISTGGKKPAK